MRTPAWRRIIDTSLDSPDDVCAWADAPTVQDATYVVQPRSVVLLIATSPAATTASRKPDDPAVDGAQRA